MMANGVIDPAGWFARANGRELIIALMLASTAIIVTAFAFEFAGYLPCPLCLQQRYAYYAGMIGGTAALAALLAGQRAIAGLVLGLLALGFAINVGLGIYHSGVEWKWWAGPATCAASGAGGVSGGDLLSKLQNAKVVACDQAPWRFLGLSFAGWSVLLSAGLATLSVYAYRRA